MRIEGCLRKSVMHNNSVFLLRIPGLKIDPEDHSFPIKKLEDASFNQETREHNRRRTMSDSILMRACQFALSKDPPQPATSKTTGGLGGRWPHGLSRSDRSSVTKSSREARRASSL